MPSTVAVAADTATPSSDSTAQRYRGLSLTEALLRLQSAGLPIVFSSRLVSPQLRVELEPEGRFPSEILHEILAPHGLRAVEVTGGRLVVVRAPPPERPRPEGPAAGATEDAPRFEEEILVTPDRGRDDLLAASHSLTAAQLADRANLANDPLRAAGALPGAALGEGSSRVHVRGARDDDVLILLDGLELLAPYHLQEFDSALSIVAPASLDRVDLISSGYPAEYGDRMGGVLDLVTTRERDGRGSLGLGLTHLDATASRRFADGRGSWYVTARGGSYHLALEIGGMNADPRFWDLFAKSDYELRPGHSLRLSALVAEDMLSINATAARSETYGGNWRSRYGWLTDELLLSPALEVETIVSLGEIERDRFAIVDSSDASYSVHDGRSLRLVSAKQVWRYEQSASLALEAGAEFREMGATIDYANDRHLGGPLVPIRTIAGTGSTAFSGGFDYNQGSAFSTARGRFGALGGELGLRYDVDTLSDEEHLSPRSSIAWSLAPGLLARASWGWFYQTQRPNELQVEDDETRLQRAKRAEHRSLQLLFSRSSGTTLRMEAFQRLTSRGRARFVNLLDAATFFPELEPDRVRIAPDQGLASGLELGYEGRRDRASWRFAYTYAKAVDRIEGRLAPRAQDQRHSFSAGLAYRWPRGWSCDAAWTYHSGWPTTSIDLDASRGGAPIVGPFNAERLPSYHRLDLRIAKAWESTLGTFTAHVDLQNLYDRRNVRGRTGFRVVSDASGGLALDSRSTHWNGVFPSFGLRWSF